jgi:uncharacterized membrane protein
LSGPDAALNRHVSLVLQVGMLSSLALLIIGLVWYALAPSGTDFTMGPAEAFKATISGDPVGLICLGIMLLIATPLLRILVTLGTFLKLRDWKFVAISLTVLLVIATAILIKG